MDRHLLYMGLVAAPGHFGNLSTDSQVKSLFLYFVLIGFGIVLSLVNQPCEF